ncbi:WhiB family transcription factor [Mycobacterium phage NiebruSaylor]|nr:WhiB family transcription factor [Mycobacterium phage Vorrps]QFP97070.1 WhiB family transcription factor [Mycobacterium phage Krili]QOC58456.1 WhiB family transcription factor [Mycobacterium phage Shida]QOC59223.1 WhiB family transcription factor [Mycobacterium phage NiebruSaylor]QWY81509.1 WhiB family transcription factor [Mycobacterium phage Winget]QXO13396.1 WhiB family transcription factor [Mycobacterium phage Murai]UAW08375.1 WhiB family transcription factor [Mycobacterium phage Mori]
MLYAACVPATNEWHGAACAARRDLPWTADTMPSAAQRRRMSAVCAECPVLTRCAMHALKGVTGGFYAGVWIPWKGTAAATAETRRSIRASLRRVVTTAS